MMGGGIDWPSQHPVPDVIPDAAHWRLVVDGLVHRPLRLGLADLLALPQEEHRGSYTCERGWEDADYLWRGPRLQAVLALAEPLAEGRALYAYAAGGWRAAVPQEAFDWALLALELNGRPLTRDRGAPCRLFVFAPDVALGIKWLERLELVVGTDVRWGPPKPPGE